MTEKECGTGVDFRIMEHAAVARASVGVGEYVREVAPLPDCTFKSGGAIEQRVFVDWASCPAARDEDA